MKRVRTARAPWSELVLVCGKCARKAGRKSFRKELSKALKALSPGAGKRVVACGCLDLCPKGRITLAAGPGTAVPRLLVVQPDSASAAASEILARHAIDTAGAGP